jgi:hypothetical protein
MESRTCSPSFVPSVFFCGNASGSALRLHKKRVIVGSQFRGWHHSAIESPPTFVIASIPLRRYLLQLND